LNGAILAEILAFEGAMKAGPLLASAPRLTGRPGGIMILS
jgi:hypothetical protein